MTFYLPIWAWLKSCVGFVVLGYFLPQLSNRCHLKNMSNTLARSLEKMNKNEAGRCASTKSRVSCRFYIIVQCFSLAIFCLLYRDTSTLVLFGVSSVKGSPTKAERARPRVTFDETHSDVTVYLGPTQIVPWPISCKNPLAWLFALSISMSTNFLGQRSFFLQWREWYQTFKNKNTFFRTLDFYYDMKCYHGIIFHHIWKNCPGENFCVVMYIFTFASPFCIMCSL